MSTEPMVVPIRDLVPGLVPGVEVELPATADAYRERYFEWKAWSLVAKFKTKDVSGGLLTAWHHVPVFGAVENHEDAEIFSFLQGTAVMLFIDYRHGHPDADTAQVVRVRAGTQIVVAEGKGHFVAVAEGHDPVVMVVVSPRMDAPRQALERPIEGRAR